MPYKTIPNQTVLRSDVLPNIINITISWLNVSPSTLRSEPQCCMTSENPSLQLSFSGIGACCRHVPASAISSLPGSKCERGEGGWLHKSKMLHTLLEEIRKGTEKEGRKKIGGCNARAPTCASLQATLSCSKQAARNGKNTLDDGWCVAELQTTTHGRQDGVEMASRSIPP